MANSLPISIAGNRDIDAVEVDRRADDHQPEHEQIADRKPRAAGLTGIWIRCCTRSPAGWLSTLARRGVNEASANCGHGAAIPHHGITATGGEEPLRCTCHTLARREVPLGPVTSRMTV